MNRSMFFWLLAASMLVFACQRENLPTEADGRNYVLQHFAKPHYEQLVQVLEVSLREGFEDMVNDSRFYEMHLDVLVHIPEDYLVSKISMDGVFQVNRQWPEFLAQRLEMAETEEQRKFIQEQFDFQLFRAGDHQLEAKIVYAFIEGRWVIHGADIDSIEFWKNVDDQPLAEPEK